MPDTIDIVLRTVTVMAALLLGILLLVSRRKSKAALPGAFLSFAVAAFFVSSSPLAEALAAWRYPLTAICVTKAVWFWLFARALFNDEAQIGPRHFAIAGLIAFAGTWQQMSFLPAHRVNDTGILQNLVGFGFEACLLVFVVLGLCEAWRGMATDLVEQRRHLRVGFLIATGIYLTATLGVQSFNLLMDTATPLVAARANMFVVANGALAAAWFLLQIRSNSWLEPTKINNVIALNPAETAILKSLERALENDRIYLREGLTIRELAEHLGTGEHVLRQVINRAMGHRNFNDFLHAWRVREACEELARPEQARQPVLSIAMKVGYGSIGAFNRAFKARVGMTPTDYRRAAVSGATRAA